MIEVISLEIVEISLAFNVVQMLVLSGDED